MSFNTVTTRNNPITSTFVVQCAYQVAGRHRYRQTDAWDAETGIDYFLKVECLEGENYNYYSACSTLEKVQIFQSTKGSLFHRKLPQLLSCAFLSTIAKILRMIHGWIDDLNLWRACDTSQEEFKQLGRETKRG